jgi:hypothetical protein
MTEYWIDRFARLDCTQELSGSARISTSLCQRVLDRYFVKILMDTHIFLWWDSEPDKLSVQARTLCENPENVLLLSLASIWEMQIKQQLGKLQLSFLYHN